MPKRFKCGGCKKWITDEETWTKTALQRWCSEDCMRGKQRASSQSAVRPHRKPSKRRKDEIPPATRELIYVRDRRSCRFCKRSNVALHIHHINYRSEGVDHQSHNLILLCQEHHDLMHSNKKKWKPILLGWIWLTYVEGVNMTVPQAERWLSADSTETFIGQVLGQADVSLDFGTVVRHGGRSER